MLRGLGPDALLRLSRPVCVVRVCARTQAHDGSSAHHFAPLCETLEDLHCKQESEKALLNWSEDKQAVENSKTDSGLHLEWKSEGGGGGEGGRKVF